jgi:hypothetical protein
MNLIQIDHDPSRRKLAFVGLLWLVLLAVLGTIVLKKTGYVPAAAAIWAAALLVAVIGWLAPGLMRICYLVMACAALPIGLVLSPLVLAVVYYLVLTPTSLLMRLFGYDPMRRRFNPDAGSYWLPRDQDEDVSRYFRQF